MLYRGLIRIISTDRETGLAAAPDGESAFVVLNSRKLRSARPCTKKRNAPFRPVIFDACVAVVVSLETLCQCSHWALGKPPSFEDVRRVHLSGSDAPFLKCLDAVDVGA